MHTAARTCTQQHGCTCTYTQHGCTCMCTHLRATMPTANAASPSRTEALEKPKPHRGNPKPHRGTPKPHRGSHIPPTGLTDRRAGGGLGVQAEWPPGPRVIGQVHGTRSEWQASERLGTGTDAAMDRHPVRLGMGVSGAARIDVYPEQEAMARYPEQAAKDRYPE